MSRLTSDLNEKPWRRDPELSEPSTGVSLRHWASEQKTDPTFYGAQLGRYSERQNRC